MGALGEALDLEEGVIDGADFRSMFEGFIGAKLDWALVQAAEPKVAVERCDSLDELAELRTVWYADPAGAFTTFDSPGARPVTAGEAANLIEHWPVKRRDAVLELASFYRRSSLPVQLILPTYRLPDGHALLMDGTHRTVAVLVAERPVVAILIELQGPPDAAVLPDLAHY